MATIETPLIVITGPTASGKSGLALRLAERYNGEIICADSRTVYKGMDIGTAKPSEQEQALVPHHLLDVVAPDVSYNVALFQAAARSAIQDIRSRGKVPFLVGGNGLYIDSVVLNYQLGAPSDKKGRAALEGESIPELQLLLKKHHISLPTNSQNRRHLIRAWEQRGVNTHKAAQPLKNTYVVAIATDRLILQRNIEHRIDDMFKNGVVQETSWLASVYGWQANAMTSNIYGVIRHLLSGEITETEAKRVAITRDRQLAKRQRTWLKRHNFVQWLSLEEAEQYVGALLDR